MYSEEQLKEAEIKDTYFCGADGKLCEFTKTDYPEEFPCQTCERNTYWKLKVEGE